MTTGFDEFDNRIRELSERERECEGLFEEIRRQRRKLVALFGVERFLQRVEKGNFQERYVSGTNA
jgi:hypothetical protein